MDSSFRFLSRSNRTMFDDYDRWCDAWRYHALNGDADFFLKSNEKKVDEFGMTPLMWYIVADSSYMFDVDKCRRMVATSDITAQNILGHTARDIFLILSESNMEYDFFDLINCGDKPRLKRLFGELEEFEKDQICWDFIRNKSREVNRTKGDKLKNEANTINTLFTSDETLDKERNAIKDKQDNYVREQLNKAENDYIEKIHTDNPKDEFETTKEYDERIRILLKDALKAKKVKGYNTKLPKEEAEAVLARCETELSTGLSKLENDIQQKKDSAQNSLSKETLLFTEYICPTSELVWGDYNADKEILSVYFGSKYFSIKVNRDCAKQIKKERIPYDIRKNLIFNTSSDFYCDVTITIVTDVGEFKSDIEKVPLFECCKSI